jgi:hypothetical protein
MGAQDRKVRQGRDGRAGGMTARISGMTGDQISALEMLDRSVTTGIYAFASGHIPPPPKPDCDRRDLAAASVPQLANACGASYYPSG